MKQAELGDLVMDKVSMFKGVAVASHDYLMGCQRLTVQPEINKDGSLPESQTFDTPQLAVVTAGYIKIGDRTTGGTEKYSDEGR